MEQKRMMTALLKNDCLVPCVYIYS
jgi:hypothetical protein